MPLVWLASRSCGASTRRVARVRGRLTKLRKQSGRLDLSRKGCRGLAEGSPVRTCHHGTMTVWAMSEAKSRGFVFERESFAEVVKWTTERLKDVDKPRDTRPGWNMLNTPAVYLATMALCIPKQEALSPDDGTKIAGHLLRHQEENGSWAWSRAPAKNRPPPVFESDEVVTLLAFAALGTQVPPDAKDKSEALAGREKAAGVARSRSERHHSEPKQSGSSATCASKQPRSFGRESTHYSKRPEQGWRLGSVEGRASDAFATGQVLYFLNVAGVKNDDAAVDRGVAFLVKTQKDDGSWPMKSQAHPVKSP